MAHPERSREWLAERVRDGFDVHHIDGDSENNDDKNLMLLDHADHMMLHFGIRRGFRVGGNHPGELTPPLAPVNGRQRFDRTAYQREYMRKRRESGRIKS